MYTDKPLKWFYSEIAFDTKSFVLSYSVDVVSTLSYFLLSTPILSPIYVHHAWSDKENIEQIYETNYWCCKSSQFILGELKAFVSGEHNLKLSYNSNGKKVFEVSTDNMLLMNIKSQRTAIIWGIDLERLFQPNYNAYSACVMPSLIGWYLQHTSGWTQLLSSTLLSIFWI